jgi:hypothetical protein
MKRMMRWLAPTLALAALPGLALADTFAQKRNLDVQAQAGLLTYTGEAARFTSPGVSYGVLGSIDVVPWVGAELSYQGAAYDTDQRVSPTSQSIAENGGQLAAKVGPELRNNLHPYALGGIAVSELNVKDADTAFGVVDDATLIKVPLGVGIDWNSPIRGNALAGFSLGARATYNLAVDSGAFPLTSNASSSSQLVTTVQLGARF